MSRQLQASTPFAGQISTQTQLRNAANGQTNRPERFHHLVAAQATPAGQVSAGQGRDRNSTYWAQVAAGANSGSAARLPSVHSFVRRNPPGARRRAAPVESQARSQASVQHGQYINRGTVDAASTSSRSSDRAATLAARKRSFLGDATTRLKGVVYDLGNWKDLPVSGGVGAKIKYVFGRDKRPWSIVSVLGCLLFIGLVILAIYFISKAASKSGGDLKGGGSAAMRSSINASAVPSSTSAGVSSMDFETSEQMINQFAGGDASMSLPTDSDLMSGEFPFIDFQ